MTAGREGYRASISARYVAIVRGLMDRPQSVTGDVDAERALHASLLDERASFWRFMTSRTRFIDACLIDALADGIGQVVTIGAGFDGRALRFRTPGVRFFELDLATTHDDKRGRLIRLGIDTTGLTMLATDLMTDRLEEVLAGAGHDADAPSLFICEGVLLYLNAAAVERTLSGARAAAGAGSRLATTFALGEAPAAEPSWTGEDRQTFYRAGEVAELLSRTGWHCRRCIAPDGDGSPVAQFCLAEAVR
ncbi:MAG TPA: SAM-dependent methyltransferase [Micromonosporaceae bacterium]|jgi:methyltransferase (TIGR00027 family)